MQSPLGGDPAGFNSNFRPGAMDLTRKDIPALSRNLAATGGSVSARPLTAVVAIRPASLGR